MERTVKKINDNIIEIVETITQTKVEQRNKNVMKVEIEELKEQISIREKYLLEFEE